MDAKNFRHILLSCYDSMYRTAFSVIGNSDDAQDAVQDAAVKLWINRNRLSSADSPKAFCMTAARNAAIDLIRMKGGLPLSYDEIHERPDDNADIDELIDAKSALNQVAMLIERLDPQHREILLLRSQSGLSVAEIAEMKGITPDYTRTILSRARKKLKELYLKIK